jgi:hypothetical protein
MLAKSLAVFDRNRDTIGFAYAGNCTLLAILFLV